MATLYERIQGLCEQRQISGYRLCKETGIQPSTLTDLKKGRKKTLSAVTLTKIASYFDVSVEYLLGRSVLRRAPEPEQEQEQDSGDPPLPPGAYPYLPSQRIPILGRIAAGLPIYAEENIEGYTYTDLNGGGEYFALRVSGDSMDRARIFDGDILIVRRQDMVETGEIAVVMVNENEATVKRFYQTDSVVTLIPDSSNRAHKPQVYDLKDTAIKILGKVVKVEFMVF